MRGLEQHVGVGVDDHGVPIKRADVYVRDLADAHWAEMLWAAGPRERRMGLLVRPSLVS